MYCPNAGDIIWIDFDPTKGHEQRGRRPALVLSSRRYNERGANLCIACPITSRRKGYPFEVPIPQGHAASGVVLADQIRSVSWLERGAEFLTIAPAEVVDDVREKIAALLAID